MSMLRWVPHFGQRMSRKLVMAKNLLSELLTLKHGRGSRCRLQFGEACRCGPMVLRVDLEADKPASELLGGGQRRAGAGERIEHDAARRTEG
jgi:hypothetical protein